MGCDIDWGTAHTESAAGGSGDAAVLPASGNDGDVTEDSDKADTGSAAAAAASRPRRGGTAAAAAAGGGGGADAAADAAADRDAYAAAAMAGISCS